MKLLIAAFACVIAIVLQKTSAANAEEEIEESTIRKAIFDAIDPNRIRDVLHAVTREPHQAGTKANRRVAETIANTWRQNGLEDVHFVKYQVLLNYPNWDQPNHFAIVGDREQQIFRSLGLSPDLNPPRELTKNRSPKNKHSSSHWRKVQAHLLSPNDNHARIQWLAYSANGTVDAEPVYCHYGKPEDFELLKKMNISVEGKIAIMRYEHDFRGDKVHHAEQNGAAAAILYTDPREFGANLSEPAYPNTAWMPAGGVQRGTVMLKNGDPLSPILPSRADLFPGLKSGFEPEKDARGLRGIPTIPVLPISFADAYQILSRMGGVEAPVEWQGAMNFTYRIGPGFERNDDSSRSDVLEDEQAKSLRVEVRSKMEIREIQNVVGYFYGEDRDTWVMLGNHYDAWTYGALDPNSGTAVLAEVARAFATSSQTLNWRPRRTLVFCAWDAEEYGLIGSSEFVQEFTEILRDRAIVYLNVDLIQGNKTLTVDTVPTLFRAAAEAAKVVQDPNSSHNASLFNTWFEYFPSNTSWQPDIPDIKVPGGGSDHMQFLNFLGVPVADISFHNGTEPGYPLYHTMYEVPHLSEHIIDRNNMAVHKAVGQFWAELARTFSDSPVIPLNATVFAQQILLTYLHEVKESTKKLMDKYPTETADARTQLSNLLRATQEFLRRSTEVQAQIEQTILRRDQKMMDRINRRLQKIDQCFINPSLGMAAKDPENRHVLYSLSAEDGYQGTAMASVNLLIQALEAESVSEKRLSLGRELAFELTVVQYSVQCAINTLQDYI